MAADTTEPTLTIEFEVSGEKFTNVTEYQIQDSFMVDADAWSATVFSQDPVALRRKFIPKTRVRLYLGDRLQLIGQIDKTEGAGGGSAALKISGRDYFANLVDPNIDPAVAITSKMSLADALIEGLRVFGITEVETTLDGVLNSKLGSTYKLVQKFEVGADPSRGFGFQLKQYTVREPSNDPVEDATPKKSAGEGALEWAQRLAARHGFIIQPGTKRSAIAVVVPDYTRAPVFNLSRPGNLQDGRAVRDWAGVPTLATLSGRKIGAGSDAKGGYDILTPVGDESKLSIWNIEECKRILTLGRAIGERIPVKQKGDPGDWYCPVYYRDDDAKSEAMLNRSARRMMADQIRPTLTYEASLKGHVDQLSGATYCTNVLANVSDAVEDVNETLWVMDRMLSYSPGNGETTVLNLIRPASYVL